MNIQLTRHGGTLRISIVVPSTGDEATLLRALAERLPGMKQDQALVAVNAAALEMILRLSACNLCGGLGRVADDLCPNGCAR